jgi:hypothetical protein
MNSQAKRLRVGLAIVATTIGAGLGGAAIAGAATTSTTSGSTATTAPAATSTAPDSANGSGETALTGTTAEKVKAAALAAVPGGTIDRVETDSGGAAYEAHVTKSDGTQVTVLLDESFKVTDVKECGGPGGGDRAGPPSGE